MKHYHYTNFFEKGQQKIKLYLYEDRIPNDDPVYTLKNILEGMNFEKLLNQYSNKGRKGYNPIMIYAIILYANMRGIFSVDKIVESCERDLGFIWLAGGEQPRRDVFYDFFNSKLTIEIIEDLHYQFIRRLEKENFVTLKTLFIDGTKIEANAGRYTFVWRGSINYHLINLLDQINELFKEYNTFIKESKFDKRYHLAEKEMIFIEGEERVRKIIEENRKRKHSNKEKIQNNTILEIDNVSPIDMLNTASAIYSIAVEEGIIFASGKGQKKTTLQRFYESFMDKGERLLKYKRYFENMGKDRNSYSKTDIEATFMRMKEDHMKNGQLKPAYNLQFAVENYFIVHTYVSNDRTDYKTLVPVVKKHQVHLHNTLMEVVADSGYSSEENLLYLKENEIESYIKLTEHEKKKSKKYYEDISKYYNMKTTTITDGSGNPQKAYICHNNRLLKYQKSEIRRVDGFERTFEIYASETCGGCLLKSECLYKYDPTRHEGKNKLMKINQRWDHLKSMAEENVLSEKGIKYRQIRSVMTEGSFGDMKENDGYRRFHRRGAEKVTKEITLYVMARNINKYYRFKQNLLEKYEGKVA